MATVSRFANRLPPGQEWKDLLEDILPPQGEWSEEAYLVLTDHRNRLVDVEVQSAGGVLLTSIQYRYDVADRRIAGGRPHHASTAIVTANSAALSSRTAG